MIPFFSIIIPLYNKEKYIQNTLKSILEQTFQNFEIIIVNDGSTDKSVALAEQVNDDRISFIHQPNQGVSVARNKGVELAKAEYICFLDADDQWDTIFLEKMYQLIALFPNENVFSAAIQLQTNTTLIPATYSISNKVLDNIYIENYFRGSMKYNIICTSCAVFHNSVFSVVGKFDIEIRSGQDIDLWIRIGNNFSVVFLNIILCTYIYDEKSLSRNKKYKTIKLKYEKYEKIELQNIDIKKYLDYNRYSEVLNNKIYDNKENVRWLISQINYKNLGLKQRVLIQLPNFILRLLYNLQPILIKVGLRKTIYK